MRPDGTLWLNLGDSYTSGGRVGHGTRVGYKQQTNRGMNGTHDPARAPQPPGLKAKDRIGLPHMLTFALRADGWYWRDEIVWHKPNPMPSSQQDRCTVAHEFVFMFSKRAKYYYDAMAIAEPLQDYGQRGTESAYEHVPNGGKNDGLGKLAQRIRQARLDGDRTMTRTKRSVWTIATQPTHDAHFATFPQALVEPMIRASTSERGCCETCGAPWRRVVDRYRTHNGQRADNLGAWRNTDLGSPSSAQGDGHWRYSSVSDTLGWRPTCPHYPRINEWQEIPRPRRGEDDEPYRQRIAPVLALRQALLDAWRDLPTSPCVVLDPFAGSGTSLMVADQLGREAIGIELNPNYVQLIKRRLEGDAPLFLDLKEASR